MKQNTTYPAIVGTSAIEMCGGSSAFDTNLIDIEDYRLQVRSSRGRSASRYTMRQALHDSRELSARTESGIVAGSLLMGTVIGCAILGLLVTGLILFV